MTIFFFFFIQAKPIPENVSSKCGHYVSVGESVGESVSESVGESGWLIG